MLHTLAISNYRSILELVVELGALNVVSGPNGAGKSNLYRALRLLAQTASGGWWARSRGKGASTHRSGRGPRWSLPA
jgi:predicted ATPase